MDGIRERAVLVVVVVFVCIISLFHVGFAAPYPSYVYDFWHQPVPAPDAYLPVRAVSGRDLGIGDFSDAQDLAVGRDGTIYIADTGNNRLVLLDASFSLVRVISEFDRDGAPDRLSAPSG
ncbi:MAG: gluconolactonase, partial [Firmicutes bacterium]|nr:gluconolactonase [Bacillota bacterium]